MKAKSWKKFVPKDKSKVKDAPIFGSDQKPEKNEVFDSALSQNDTLKKLIAEREKLEQKMSEAAGVSMGSFTSASQQSLGEIQSFSSKRKEEVKWIKDHQKQIDKLRTKQNKEKQIPTGLKNSVGSSNVTSLTAPDPVDSYSKKLKKEDKRIDKPLSKTVKKKDDWETRKERLEAKRKLAKKELGKVKNSIKSAEKELDKFAEADKEFGGDSTFGKDITKLKDKFGTGSKLDKMTTSFEKKRGGEKLDQKWNKLKNKKRELNGIMSKYEARRKRLLSAEKGTTEELDEKRRAKTKSAMDKRKDERKEAEKEEQKKKERTEENEAQKKEERTEEKHSEEKEVQQKEQNKKERIEEKEAEEREAQKKEQKKKERAEKKEAKEKEAQKKEQKKKERAEQRKAERKAEQREEEKREKRKRNKKERF